MVWRRAADWLAFMVFSSGPGGRRLVPAINMDAE
jgi:hypothetical protein